MWNTKIIWQVILGWLLFVGACPGAFAQYNPDDPPEPQRLFRLTVKTDPADVGYASGAGEYATGERVYLNSSSNNRFFKFTGWTKNGEPYSMDRYTYYTMGEEDVEFVAHYEYKFIPDDPDEPFLNEKSTLKLRVDPQNCGSLNTDSGNRYFVGDNVYLKVYPNKSYDFLGWYEGSELVSRSLGFYYEIPGRNVTLVAKLKLNYDPADPEEPDITDPQPDIQNKTKGDVNGDGEVTAVDLVLFVDLILKGNTQDLPLGVYDINNDGRISIADVVALVKVILEKE